MAFLGPSLRRARVRERPAARLGAAVLASLLANALLLVGAWRMGAFDLAKPVKEQRVVLAPLTADQWSHNRAIAGQPLPPATRPFPPPPAIAQAPRPAPPPPPKPNEPDDLHAPAPIVDVAPSKNSTPPKDARVVAEHDSTVEKETVSRAQATRVYKNRAAAPEEGEDRKAPQQRQGEAGQASETREAKKGPDAPNGTGAEHPAPKPGEKPAEAEKDRQLAMLEPRSGEGLTPRTPRGPQPPPAAPGTPGQPGAPGEAQRKLGDARLLPSAQSMSKVMAGPSNNDLSALGVEEGDATQLNTRAFKYAGFYNRVMQSIVEQWRPGDVYLARDPRLTTFPLRDRATTFRMVLDPTGNVRTLQLLESCGLDFLDREVLRAVRAAAPFENVPPELAAAGKVVFPPQTFVLVMPKEGGIQLRMQPPDPRDPFFR